MVYLPHWPVPGTLGKRQINYETVFERMSEVLEKLGNPHQNLPPVIHVSGTNGKGSVTSLIAKIFSCAGYKAHIYTSPHLHDCNERIVLAGEKISNGFLFEIMEEVRIAAGEIPLTFMEAFTIGAFLAFRKTPADVAIIECGMGGRIDATNIIEKKLATVITPISFDHTEYLGNSIERIALEKVMIARPEAPLIVGPQSQKSYDIIKIIAADQGLKTYFYDRDYEILRDEESGEFDLRFADKSLNNLPKPALLGDHQYLNFATAIATVLAISDKFDLPESAIKQAVSTVKWPSRLEKITGNLSKILANSESELWIDGAHNEAGALAVARFLSEEKNKKLFVVCGFSRGKCKKEFLEKFKNVAEGVGVRVNGEPYPEDPKVISEMATTIGMKVFAAADLLEALHHIKKVSCGDPCKVVICGSLHLARDVRRWS